MTASSANDFASLLDELMASAEIVEVDRGMSRPPNIDYLAIADELLSLSIVTGEAENLYRQMAEEPVTLAPSLSDVTSDAIFPPAALPSIDPQDIARELALDLLHSTDEIDRLRRQFAFQNHPDRVAAHIRSNAQTRMQTANQLMDEARSKLATLRKKRNILRWRSGAGGGN